jgi:hypothetical protein
VIAATYVLSTITFFSQFAHPFNDPFALHPGPIDSAYAAQALGVLSIVFQAAVLVAVLLFVLRRFPFPTGGVLFVLAVNGSAVALMKDNYWAIAVAVLGGLAGEVLAAALRPGPTRQLELRLFAAALPLALYAFYFAALALLGGIWWPPTVWLGALFLSGAAGLMVSYAVFPPALPRDGPGGS